MKTFFYFLFFLLGMLSAQYQQTDSLDKFIAKLVIDYKVPGISIGIIKDNKIFFKKGYGVISTIDSIPVTNETIFPVLSCTKAFTAAAIGMLVDQGKMHWD